MPTLDANDIWIHTWPIRGSYSSLLHTYGQQHLSISTFNTSSSNWSFYSPFSHHMGKCLKNFSLLILFTLLISLQNKILSYKIVQLQTEKTPNTTSPTFFLFSKKTLEQWSSSIANKKTPNTTSPIFFLLLKTDFWAIK